jgi:hypothetical protein
MRLVVCVRSRQRLVPLPRVLLPVSTLSVSLTVLPSLYVTLAWRMSPVLVFCCPVLMLIMTMTTMMMTTMITIAADVEAADLMH